MSLNASLPAVAADLPQPSPLPALSHAGRKLYVETFGCQMNEHDTLRLVEQLTARGFERSADPDEASLFIVNTCSVREHAVQKALSHLGRFRELKKTREVKVAVTGCVAQQEGEALLAKYKDIDLVLGPDNIYQVGPLIDRVFLGDRVAKAELDESAGFQFLSSPQVDPMQGEPRPAQAFVTVQKGCDKNCSYCIVPRVRGREVSRPLAEIVSEVIGLVAAGAREVTLLGQNIDAYRDPDQQRFDQLLRAVGQVEGLKRLRFTTSHPNDFSQAMAQAMADLPTICEHLHLPVQSGADAVLKRMYRGYSRARYLEKVALVRQLIPDLTLTTDLIVGFPGESEADFEQTLTLVDEVGFDSAFVFSYSVRPGTPAAPWADPIPEPEKRRRLLCLIEAVRVTALRRISRFVGRRMEVLVEGPSRTDPAVLTGRLRHNSVVNFRGAAKPGELVQVDITAAQNGFSLVGALVS